MDGDFSTFHTGQDFATELDRQDSLGDFRSHFHIPSGTVYLDGNSLGLLSEEAEQCLLRVKQEWKEMAIRGWLEAGEPWFYYAEKIGALASGLVGATPREVIATGSTTVNIHALLGSFYRPAGSRTRILADETNFPSDIYALKSHLLSRGLDPGKHLLLVRPGPDGLLDEEQIVSLMTAECALVFLSAAQFRSGQLLDISYLTREAHKRNIPIGFDCSHSAGVIDHNLHGDEVDFATWCGYKYLNGGPGSSAFIFIHESHFGLAPSMTGWFGYKKDRQFEMSLDFVPEDSAGGWQISTPGLLSLAPLEGSIKLLRDAGIGNIRHKSLQLTKYLLFLTENCLGPPPYSFFTPTPTDNHRRGGHVALCREEETWRICQALKASGFLPDFRPPDIIRVAPVALYNSYTDIWKLVSALMEIIDRKEYLRFSKNISPVS